MKFKPYCILVIGNTIGTKELITKVAQNTPNFIDGKGLYIATFVSNFTTPELTDLFNSDNRNFFIFELDNKHSGYHISKPEMNEGLFGFLKDFDKDFGNDLIDFKSMAMSFDISFDPSVPNSLHDALRKGMGYGSPITKTRPSKVTNISEEDILKMNTKEKEVLLNKIIDRGIENMTDNDKKIMGYLTK